MDDKLLDKIINTELYSEVWKFLNKKTCSTWIDAIRLGIELWKKNHILMNVYVRIYV